MNPHNLQECVSKKVEFLHSEDPKRPNAQNVAMAYKHCREQMAGDSKIGIDSITYTNQVIANEGVLDYNGKKMAKLWTDLKQFDGILVPIVDEHPPSNNGNDGKVSANDKVYGYAKIHCCIKNEPVLCADVTVDSNAPKKDGYSIGFVYNEIDTAGVIDGSKYDGIQKITEIDHLALTSFPRNSIALASDALQLLQTATDSSNGVVIKYYKGYEKDRTFKTDSKKVLEKKSIGDTDLKNAEGKEVESDEDENMSEEEKKKKESADAKKKSKDSTQFDSSAYDSKIQMLEKQNKKFEADAKRYKEEYEKEVAKTIGDSIDSLIKQYPKLDLKAFDGKSKDFVDGMKALDSIIQSEPTSSISGSTDVDSNSGDSVEFDSPNNYRFNAETRKMEKIVKVK